MMKEETTYHIPVLLMPSVDAMNIRPDGPDPGWPPHGRR